MQKKILLVDDDYELCEEMKETLEEEGYLVETACEGKKGESLIKSNTYDVVLLDFKMPGLNGIDILRKVKESRPATRVFIISGKPFIEKYLEEEKLANFIAGFMNKPFEVEKLIEKIKSNG